MQAVTIPEEAPPGGRVADWARRAETALGHVLGVPAALLVAAEILVLLAGDTASSVGTPVDAPGKGWKTGSVLVAQPLTHTAASNSVARSNLMPAVNPAQPQRSTPKPVGGVSTWKFQLEYH